MKKIIKVTTLLTQLTLSLSAYELTENALFIPSDLKRDISSVTYEEGIFKVNTNEGNKEIKGHDLDKTLRDLVGNNYMIDFLESGNGYLKIKQYSNGDYGLSMHARLRGGGPISGAIAWGLTATVGYACTAAFGTVSTAGTVNAVKNGVDPTEIVLGGAATTYGSYLLATVGASKVGVAVTAIPFLP